jgi:hypothetical protein
MDAMESVNKLMPKVVVVSLENRQHVAPEYLFAQIPRTHYEAIETGRKSKDVRPILQAKMVKIWTGCVAQRPSQSCLRSKFFGSCGAAKILLILVCPPSAR